MGCATASIYTRASFFIKHDWQVLWIRSALSVPSEDEHEVIDAGAKKSEFQVQRRHVVSTLKQGEKQQHA